MKEELKACPRCRGKARLITAEKDKRRQTNKIECIKKPCISITMAAMFGVGAIVKLWNTRQSSDPWDHISPEYREGMTYTLHVDIYGKWYIKNELLSGTAAARGEMGDPGRNGEKKIVREGVWI